MSSFFFNNSKLQLSNENSLSFTKKECKNDSNKVPSTTENLKTKQESNKSESKKCTDWKFKLTIAVDIIGGLLLVAAVVLKIVQKSSKDDTDVMGIWHIIALVFDCVASISLKVYIVCMNYYLYSTTLKKKVIVAIVIIVLNLISTIYCVSQEGKLAQQLILSFFQALFIIASLLELNYIGKKVKDENEPKVEIVINVKPSRIIEKIDRIKRINVDDTISIYSRPNNIQVNQV